MGVVLAIVGAISTTVPSTTALIDAAWFAAGVSLAVLLSSIFWPVWTHLPVRRAVTRVYEELAAYATEIRATLEAGKRDQGHWTDLALLHPRLVRGAIEQARAVSLAVRARRVGESPMGSDLRVLLGLGETQFLLLISLATELEALSAHPASAEESLARTGERRRLTLPRRLRTRAIVLRPGALAPSLRASTCEIFCGPQLGRRSLSSRMETTISSPVASGLETGRRLCSTSPK